VRLSEILQQTYHLEALRMMPERAEYALRGMVAMALLCTYHSIGADDTVCSSPECLDSVMNTQWKGTAEMYEYASNANPTMSEVPVKIFPPSLHQEGVTRVISFDTSADLQLDYPATSPNLLASFVRIVEGENLNTGVELAATSQAFYVIRGKGKSITRAGDIDWAEGDMFVLPYLGDDLKPVCEEGGQCVKHACIEEAKFGGCALYWVHDEPLLQYLGVRPSGKRRFEPTYYPAADMTSTVQNITNVGDDGVVKNRRGILLGNAATPQTRTLTPTLWSLLNTIGAGQHQRPHKHNSVALDLAVRADGDGTVYTKMGRELDAEGNIINPVTCAWKTGGVFITPPGWWHSHHNEDSSDAWVLPVQDAGVYTHQRTLDIRFADEEAERLKSGKTRCATIDLNTTKVSDNLYVPTSSVVAGAVAFGH